MSSFSRAKVIVTTIHIVPSKVSSVYLKAIHENTTLKSYVLVNCVVDDR